MGDPVMIAAAAADELGAPADSKRTGVRARGWFSILALGLTFVGAALAGLIAPLVLTLVGLVLMWLSQVWTVREKLWGTLLVPAPGLVLWIVLSYAGSVEECTTVVTGQDTQTVCTGGGGQRCRWSDRDDPDARGRCSGHRDDGATGQARTRPVIGGRRSNGRIVLRRESFLSQATRRRSAQNHRT
ncbi:hypothetical protein [Aeromicrobium sp. UC242_57]|uniref:hypothetical protein n=1 Tax=Aeromicrobium sp. UC242_57 TaxID=3374624 RepID=UPI0037B79B40